MATITPARPRPVPHTQFRDVTAHTAKCDVCNEKSKILLKRCLTCSWGICTPCSQKRNGDLTHGAAPGTSYPRPPPIARRSTPPQTDLSAATTTVSQSKEKQRATTSSHDTTTTQKKRKSRAIIESDDEDDASETYVPRPTISGRRAFGVLQHVPPSPSSASPMPPPPPRQQSTHRQTAEQSSKAAGKKPVGRNTQAVASGSGTPSSRHGSTTSNLPSESSLPDANPFGAGVAAPFLRTNRSSGEELRREMAALMQEYLENQDRHPSGEEPAEAEQLAGPHSQSSVEETAAILLRAKHQDERIARQQHAGSNSISAHQEHVMRSARDREAIAQAVIDSIYTARMNLSNTQFHAVMTAATEAVKHANEQRYQAAAGLSTLHRRTQVPGIGTIYIPQGSHSSTEASSAAERFHTSTVIDTVSATSGEGPRDSGFAVPFIPFTAPRQNHQQMPAKAITEQGTPKIKRSRTTSDSEGAQAPKRQKHKSSRGGSTQAQSSLSSVRQSDLSSIDTEMLESTPHTRAATPGPSNRRATAERLLGTSRSTWLDDFDMEG